MTPEPKQQLPFFLRAWQISLATKQGTYTISNSQYESLRIRFTVDTYMLLSYWKATVEIYNLSASIAKKVLGSSVSLQNPWQFGQPIVLGDTVTISAAYQYVGSGSFNPQSDLLFTGKVLQSTWTRENVTDYKLTLYVITGLIEDALNFTSTSVVAGTTAYGSLKQILSNSKNPISLPAGNIDDGAKTALDSAQLPRGQTFFGRPLPIIDEITQQHKLFAWLGSDGLHIRKFDAPFETPAYAYGPPNLPGAYAPNGTTTGVVKKTLIGTPQQTQQGIVFRVLMDSTPKIGDTVQLAPGVLINPAQVQYGQSYPALPSMTGVYVVAGVRHVGDSRGYGDDWYTEITGLVQDFFGSWMRTQLPTG